jgi:hypothetical protein
LAMRCVVALVALALASASLRVAKLAPENGDIIIPTRVLIGLASDSISASHVLYSSLAHCNGGNTTVVLAFSGFSLNDATEEHFKKVGSCLAFLDVPNLQ